MAVVTLDLEIFKNKTATLSRKYGRDKMLLQFRYWLCGSIFIQKQSEEVVWSRNKRKEPFFPDFPVSYTRHTPLRYSNVAMVKTSRCTIIERTPSIIIRDVLFRSRFQNHFCGDDVWYLLIAPHNVLIMSEKDKSGHLLCEQRKFCHRDSAVVSHAFAIGNYGRLQISWFSWKRGCHG